MKYLVCPLVSFPEWFESFSKSPYQCVMNLPAPTDKIVIAPSITSEYDTKRLVDGSYSVITTSHIGGTIVVFEDGITIFSFDRKKPEHYSKPLVSYLRSKGIDAHISGNDVLCDGYKVAGEMSRRLDNTGFYFYGIHISINADVDLINKICIKPMLKPVRGLSYYGITRADVFNALGIPE